METKKIDIYQLLSEHFMLSEFIKSNTADLLHIDNMPDTRCISHLVHLCFYILEPARRALDDSIVITSGYRSKELNHLVHGSGRSQHLSGNAADIHIKSHDYAVRLWDILKTNSHVDQLLWEHNARGHEWIHVSYSSTPRHYVDPNFKA